VGDTRESDPACGDGANPFRLPATAVSSVRPRMRSILCERMRPRRALRHSFFAFARMRDAGPFDA